MIYGMRTVIASRIFDQWMRGLRDHVGKATIAKRIDRLAQGHAGDAKSVGDGVTELRVHVGPGYRVYFTEREGLLIVLLCGGNKSTQSKDIAKAKRMAIEFKE